MENKANENQQLFMEERLQRVADIISAEGSVTVEKMKELFGISHETARRDLLMLERKGLCSRTHGGAIRPLYNSGQVSVRPPAPRDFASQPVFPDYLAIARKAASYIKENDCVYLTGGSFGHLMLGFLPRDFFYTLVVNSADLASDLRDFKNAEIYVIGGKMRTSGSTVDASAVENASRYRFDICFVTGGGLSTEFGLSNGSGETAAFQREIIKNSKRRVLLMPSKKLGHNSFVKVCDVGQFSEIITDQEAESAVIGELSDMGVDVVTVSEEE